MANSDADTFALMDITQHEACGGAEGNCGRPGCTA